MIKNNNLFILFILIIVGSIYWSYGLAKENNNEKTQTIRLIDIFIYGPFLIWLSLFLFSSKQINYYHMMFIMTTLFIMGGTTIGYNLSNYLSIEFHTK